MFPSSHRPVRFFRFGSNVDPFLLVSLLLCLLAPVPVLLLFVFRFSFFMPPMHSESGVKSRLLGRDDLGVSQEAGRSFESWKGLLSYFPPLELNIPTLGPSWSLRVSPEGRTFSHKEERCGPEMISYLSIVYDLFHLLRSHTLI